MFGSRRDRNANFGLAHERQSNLDYVEAAMQLSSFMTAISNTRGVPKLTY
jgi:hypothetical protein